MSDRRWLVADERGSVVAVSDASGAALAVNRYDEYGIPAATNLGRFQYTGQAWLPELGMYYYKARMYSATLGRFMQTDPIGYDDGMNMYAYVGGDPVNNVDPMGLRCEPQDFEAGNCRVTGRRRQTVTNSSSTGIPGGNECDRSNPRAQLDNLDRCRGNGGQRPNVPQNAFRIDKGVPPGSKQCSAGGIRFRAPRDFNPRAIVQAGTTYGLAGANSQVGHYGNFDFQRVRTASGTTFYRQYTPVSNLAVGLYLVGAGYSRESANFVSDSFASAFSSNGATAEQDKFRNLAYDISEGRAKISCTQQ